MPLYEYRCSACGAKEEKIQSFSAPTEHDCPQCGQGPAVRSGAAAMRRRRIMFAYCTRRPPGSR